MGPRLGQHFLHDRAAVRAIIRALRIKNGDAIIEIGPGKGALTIPLLSACTKAGGRLIAIEKDAVLLKTLRARLGHSASRAEVVYGDVRAALSTTVRAHHLKNGAYKIVGNIPYYLTGNLLRIIGELGEKPSLAVLTVQQEVARRVAAQPPHMNLLAAAVQFWAHPSIIASIAPTSFTPPPKVTSAVLVLAATQAPSGLATDRYYRFIRAAFKQPRKTLLNNLSRALPEQKPRIAEVLDAMRLAPSARPQDLGVPLLISIASRFAALTDIM